MTLPMLPDKDQIALIERSFPALLAVRPSIAEQFYQRLAADFPELFALFREAEPAGQQQKLLAAMTLLVTNLNQPDLLTSYFTALGERHQQYGVSNDMFKPFTRVWLTVIKDCLPDADADKTSAAWQQLLDYIVAIMSCSVTPTEDFAKTEDAAQQSLSAHLTDLLAQQQRLITQLSLSASRQPATQHLLTDLTELRLISRALQSALSNKPSS